MTVYKLKEVLNSKYNRTDEKRHHRSVLFLIENTNTGNQTLYEIDRISKHSASLRCCTRNCGSRLSIEHDIQTVPFGSGRGLLKFLFRKVIHRIVFPVTRVSK